MSFTLTVDWWAIPTIVTLAAFALALRNLPEWSDNYGAGQVIGLGFLMVAAIVSLIAWLIWALAA